MKIKEKIRGFVKIIPPLLLIIILTVSLFTTGRWFYNTSTNHLTHKQYDYITEITAREALTFKTKLEDQLLMLESLAQNFHNVDFSDYNATKEAIYATKGTGDFKRITFATLTGSTINNNNTTSGNILKKDYFERAVSGLPTISSNIEIDDDGEEVLVLAVPIKREKEIAAVLTGTFNRTLLNQLFLSDAFDGAGYSYVTDSEGNALVLPQNTNTEHIIFTDNFFSFLELSNLSNDVLVEDVIGDFALGNTNIIQYEIGQETYLAFYNPIGVHDWYSLTILSTDYIQDSISPFTEHTRLFIIIFAVLFMILVIWLVFYKFKLQKVHRLKQELRQKEKYLASVTANQHLVLFDYDYEHHTIKLSGDVKYMFQTSEEKLFMEPNDFLLHLHPQDVAVLENFRKNLTNPVSVFTCEFRFKCSDETYHWFHMQTNLVLSEEQTPEHLLGNIINVDATNKNPLIFTDNKNTLTGFLNRESFEEKVNEILRNSDPKNIYGLYLIGPDRFTTLNDIMGHETGDQILLQIAQRMSTVFSSADVFGHISGDTFAVFLYIHPDMQNHALSLIEEKANSLRCLLTDTFHSNKGSCHLTTSIGIALFAKDGANCKTLIKQAYTALNHVKKSNKGHFGIYSIEMEEF